MSTTQMLEPQAHKYDAISTFVRIAGLSLLLVGIVAVGVLLKTVWGLFENDGLVTKVAQNVDQSTGLNAFLHGMSVMTLNRIPDPRTLMGGQVVGSSPAANAQVNQPQALPHFNAAYLTSWIIVLILLSLLVKIAFRAISEGAKLASGYLPRLGDR